MKFRKTGQEIIDSCTTRINDKKEQMRSAMTRFEREKEKAALQMVSQLEADINRLERVVRHTLPDEKYELSEGDLDDFGFE